MSKHNDDIVSTCTIDKVDVIFKKSISEPFKYKGKSYEFLDKDSVPPVEIQRDFETRAQDQKTVDIFRKNLPSMREYHLQYLPNDIKYITKEDGETQVHMVKNGLYISDGCTRREVYNLGEDKGGLEPPKNGGIMYIITEVTNQEEMEAEYYSHDASTAVETIANKLSGVIRIMKLKFKSMMARAKFATVLRECYPGVVSKSTLVDMLGFYKTAAIDIDKSKIFDSVLHGLKKAQFKMAAFMFHKINHANRDEVVRILKDLGQATMSDVKFANDRAKTEVTGRTLILAAITDSQYEKVFMEDTFTSILKDRFARPTAFFLWALENELYGNLTSVKDFDTSKPKVSRKVIKQFWVNNGDNYFRTALNDLKSYL